MQNYALMGSVNQREGGCRKANRSLDLTLETDGALVQRDAQRRTHRFERLVTAGAQDQPYSQHWK